MFGWHLIFSSPLVVRMPFARREDSINLEGGGNSLPSSSSPFHINTSRLSTKKRVNRTASRAYHALKRERELNKALRKRLWTAQQAACCLRKKHQKTRSELVPQGTSKQNSSTPTCASPMSPGQPTDPRSILHSERKSPSKHPKLLKILTLHQVILAEMRKSGKDVSRYVNGHHLRRSRWVTALSRELHLDRRTFAPRSGGSSCSTQELHHSVHEH